MTYFFISVFVIVLFYFIFKKARTQEKIRNIYLPEKFIVADVETTGLDNLKDSIIEIAAIKVDSNSTNHITFRSIVNPNKKIPKKIEEITGINDEMVKNGDSIELAISEFLDFIGDLPLVFYNASFDMGFLTEAANKISREIDNEIIDALPMCRKAFPRLQNYKLSTVANKFDIKTSGAHRALKDCELTVHVYNYASYTLEKRTIKRKGTFINYQNKKINSELLKPNLDSANRDNPFYGKKVVFTGDLELIDRHTAASKIQKLGADINVSISKRTEIVIIGKEAGPSKLQKVEILKTQGNNIRLIYEDEFISLIKHYEGTK